MATEISGGYFETQTDFYRKKLSEVYNELNQCQEMIDRHQFEENLQEKLRNRYPQLKEAWEQYQFLLKLLRDK